jgi:hypothetical protein
MTSNASSAHIPFKRFPEFSKLSINDKARFEGVIGQYSPFGDIQFASLMTWWDTLDGVSVAELNGNLVIQYWRPGDEVNSGLSLVGTNQVDESFCTILDYLRQCEEPSRLVNVPEFTVSELQYPELFTCIEDRQHYEYIVPIARFYPLQNVASFKRRRIDRLIKKYGEDNLVVKSLDLGEQKNRDVLLHAAEKWWRYNLNNFGKVGLEAMRSSIQQAELLGLENACLMAGSELLGFCLYLSPSDKRYAVLTHVKTTHRDTIGFDLIAFMLAKWFNERGVLYANLTQDWGRLPLRVFLLTLGPSNFFRKYTIEPAG